MVPALHMCLASTNGARPSVDTRPRVDQWTRATADIQVRCGRAPWSRDMASYRARTALYPSSTHFSPVRWQWHATTPSGYRIMAPIQRTPRLHLCSVKLLRPSMVLPTLPAPWHLPVPCARVSRPSPKGHRKHSTSASAMQQLAQGRSTYPQNGLQAHPPATDGARDLNET